MNKTYLKIKIKSLAAEAAIIKLEERRWKARPRQKGEAPHPLYFGLREHRIGVVRRESRAALLAYGFLRGRAYATIEPAGSTPPDWKKVSEIAARFAREKSVMEQFDNWRGAKKAA